MVNPKPIIETEVRAQASSVRRFERSLRIQESCVDIRLSELPSPGAPWGSFDAPVCSSIIVDPSPR